MKDTAPKRALISVSNKAGIKDLARFLSVNGVEILSTGGTAQFLRMQGIAVRDVSDVTGHPEIMEGRVKTLHPRIHGGILSRRHHAQDQADLDQNGIGEIDIVIVNLYPFEATYARGASYEEIIENIDIGGPAMIRAAAKNHEFVTVITDPEDYSTLIEEMTAHKGATCFDFRQKMAEIAFARTAAYDAAIAAWMQSKIGIKFPRRLVGAARLANPLRYGENPHQEAAFYKTQDTGFAVMDVIQGKPLSYNNINDADAAWALVWEFDQPACAIIKHANPCGVALGEDLTEAYYAALACDPVSAFGGIVALNRPLDAKTAHAILKVFTEVIIAPEIEAEAQRILKTKPNIRAIVMAPHEMKFSRRDVAGGWLVQDADFEKDPEDLFEVVTKRTPTDHEMRDLHFAWKVAKHVKSNAIIYVKNTCTVGVGAGQMSRVDSAGIAARKALDTEEAKETGISPVHGSVVASDAFFPFADGLLQAASAGATAVIQPGGSIRDPEIIAAADAHGLAMVFTKRRHFRH